MRVNFSFYLVQTEDKSLKRMTGGGEFRKPKLKLTDSGRGGGQGSDEQLGVKLSI